MSNCKRIAVLGGGSFGTVIANIAAENGYEVTLWMRNEDAVQQIEESGINQRYLPDLVLHENLSATTDLKQAISEAQLVFFAIPSKSFRDVVEQVSGYVDRDQMVISTTKGIEPGTLNLMSDILRSELPNNRVGVMGGPNLAKEIAKHEITATVIASEDSDLRRIVQEALSCLYFRVYASADVYGVELGGALKNIYAIISGIAAAKQLGENTIAMLLTRSLAEMGRFAETQGANPMTFLGLSGVGDLIATACSPLSRNYRVGYAFGEGRNLDEAIASLGEVAEGVNTLKQVKRFADEHDIYMPLVQGLYKVLYGGESISAVIKTLMLAERNTDVEYTLPKDEI